MENVYSLRLYVLVLVILFYNIHKYDGRTEAEAQWRGEREKENKRKDW